MKNRTDDILRDRVIDFLEKIGIDVKLRRFTTDNVQIQCPFAIIPNSGHEHAIDRKPSFGLQITATGFRYNCFTCHRKGRSLVQFVDALVKEGVIESNISAYELQNSVKIEFPDYYEQHYDNVKDDTDKFKIIPGEQHFSNVAVNELFCKRKLERKTISEMGLLYDGKLWRIIFPCYNKKKIIIGYVAQFINGRLPKYKNFIDSGELLYLEWLIKGKIGIIVEGMYDAIKVYQHLRNLDMLKKYSVVGTFGSEISSTQIDLFVRYFKVLILMGDNDYGGKRMEKSIYYMCRKKLPLIYKAEYPHKDPDLLSIGSFEKSIKNIFPYGSMGIPDKKY